jgi:uncharacterized protein YecT (DUF1311 family)
LPSVAIRLNLGDKSLEEGVGPMRLIPVLCAVVVLLAAVDARAEPARCPHAKGDACEEWRFEQLDKELAGLLNGPSLWIDAMPADKRDGARAALLEAQRQWINFREAECRRELTWAFATARTERGFLASCRINMTLHRRKDLERLYRFKPQ